MTTGNLGSDSNQSSRTTNQEDFSLDTLQYTYTGLLDDVMIRYSNEYSSADFFNKMIAKNVFFGGGIYINDGYLVNHPIVRQNLYDENTLLRRMLSEGFIRILTKASSANILSEMPQRMADQGNWSYQELVNSNEWETLKPCLTRIAKSAFQKGHARSWPNRDMSYGFTKLMIRAFTEENPRNLGLANISRDEWLSIRDDFLARDPRRGGPRDKLEKAALNIFQGTRSNSDIRIAMNDVMTVGNQAYHYNFGLTLTNEDEHGVAVDTTLGAAFDELLQTRKIEQGQLDNIPLLRLPQEIPFQRGELFSVFLDNANRAGDAKLNYLRSLRNVISSESRNFDALRQELIGATDEYAHRIVELLYPALERLAQERVVQDMRDGTIIDKSFALAVGSLGTPKATAAPLAGIALIIQERAREMGRQFLVERFQLTDVSEQFDPSERIIRLGDIRPQIASLAFDENEASRFIEDIPAAPTF
ncbi:hypothetical protein [Microcystis aeruginosa]|uniref:hypothetical protein n=1 Tax=Microcystis aeruginosa TaxID=1126 RepID=UPI00232FF800|nr:hypothetical protein [Microcystis aeruginosa]MDB9415208.1 hypothetical protein [Microcystis aeruginosa CS-556/03]